MDISKLKPSGSYSLEHWKNGVLVETTPLETNLVPNEGLQLLSDALFEGGTLPAAWYIGLFETDYTPTQTVSAATINALATECTAYAEATRPAFVVASSGVGAVTNSAARAEFTMNATKNVYGIFLTSQPTKGATSGVMLSCFKSPSAKAVDNTSVLRVLGNFSIVSA